MPTPVGVPSPGDPAKWFEGRRLKDVSSLLFKDSLFSHLDSLNDSLSPLPTRPPLGKDLNAKKTQVGCQRWLIGFGKGHDKGVPFSSVAQSCPTLCNPMSRSTPGLPVHHQLPEPTQIHVHRVGDAIQPSHPLSSPSPPTFNLSQHQGLFK